MQQKNLYRLFYYSTVAAQMYEYSYTENPPNCVGGIREFILYLLIVSSVLTLLLNTSRSLLLLRIICLVSTVDHVGVTTVETRQIIRNSNKLRDVLSRSVKTELTINRYKINSRIPPTQFGGFSV